MSARRRRISSNTGVSARRRRRNTAKKPNTPPIRNGMRHAYACTSAALQLLLIHVAISDPIRIPTVRPDVSVPQAKPVRRSGTCSATNVHAPGTSPPTAAPCRMRISSSASGAA
jgi:hypothetical protein